VVGAHPPYSLADLDVIEREAVALARRTGLDPDRPFPFRVVGTAVEVTLHVLDKRDDLPHDPKQHERAKVRHTLSGVPVELIGFHSRHHRGVFTPRESNVHVHVRTADGRISGHLETIGLAPGARLAVPAAGRTQ
jgi:acetolactate decarboxylase